MTATDELRCMLDERGVEYFKHEDGEPLRKLEKADEPATSWHMGGASVCAVPIEGSDLFDLWIDHCTPEQAIAATLGRGTCHDVCNSVAEFTCSACGFNCDLTSWISLFDGDDGRHRHHHHGTPNFCPNCGRRVKVVDA